MIAFKPIGLSDGPTVWKYTSNTVRRNCDLCFSNLFSWRFLYRTEIAELDGFLLFRFYADGRQVYMMPVGEGDVRTVIEALIEDARSARVEFCLLGVCSNMRAELEKTFPERFVFESDRDYADYVYLRSDLAALRGKKYQPKRNHINKFRTLYPDYEYRPLTPELIPECLQLESLWCKANDCSENEALQNERRSMTEALGNMEALGIRGGVLHIQGRIVAFTFGAPVNQHTFDVCVEKADTDVEGAYTVINNEFARRLPEQYVYVNREEDLGLEGLRRAKLSYHPETILDKYIVTLK